MMKLYLDSETCGLHSMPVLFQFAIEDGGIELYDVWKEPIGKTLALIESWLDKTIVGFNLAFDWFQIVKTYTIFRLCDPNWIPLDHIDEIAMREPEGRDGPCIKPAGALDLMCHSRKGHLQSLMARDDIRIRKVPTALAYALAEKLEQSVHIDNIYFARRADPGAPRWHVYDRKKGGEIDKDFKDVVLKFSPAGGLKFLAEYALGLKPKYHYKDVEPPKQWYPKELGFAPFALAISSLEKHWKVWKRDKKGNPKLSGYAWPGVIEKFIHHWGTNQEAREYASDDILYTRELDKFFGYPEVNDDDSLLTIMVPIVRWRGFRIDIPGIRRLHRNAKSKVDASPVNVNKPSEVRAYLEEAMDDVERIVIQESTKKGNLEAIRHWNVLEDETCTKCEGQGCMRCGGSGTLSAADGHPAAQRAHELLEIKKAVKEVQLYKKLLLAGRFHASFNVLGTKSARMSGGDGLNAQGIKSTNEVRRCFPLAWKGAQLCGGDFDAFEVTLADAVYNDPKLRDALLSKQKIHALFAMSLFPGTTYEEILASKRTDQDMYHAGKAGVFAIIYGGDHNTLVRKLGIAEKTAIDAFHNFDKRFPGVGKARQKTFDKFCSMRQPGGIGSQVFWHEPVSYIESFLGFKRDFTLENRICKVLFDLAQKPPKEWRQCKIKVWRRDRVQTAGGAVSSALYGAAFGLQQSNMRAAANHEIQSPGGQITKRVQQSIWDLQPVGVHELCIAPMNIHDEIMVVVKPSYVKRVTNQVHQQIESYRTQVPLIGMTWSENLPSWGF